VGPRETHREGSHFLLLFRADSIEAEVRERTHKAISGRNIKPVRRVSKLCEQVQNPRRCRPPESSETPEFGRSVVSDEETARADVERRPAQCNKLVLPDPKPPPAVHFPGDHANGDGTFTVTTPEFEIAKPDFPVTL
jgi:hypothetical protein